MCRPHQQPSVCKTRQQWRPKIQSMAGGRVPSKEGLQQFGNKDSALVFSQQQIDQRRNPGGTKTASNPSDLSQKKQAIDTNMQQIINQPKEELGKAKTAGDPHGNGSWHQTKSGRSKLKGKATNANASDHLKIIIGGQDALPIQPKDEESS